MSTAKGSGEFLPVDSTRPMPVETTGSGRRLAKPTTSGTASSGSARVGRVSGGGYEPEPQAALLVVVTVAAAVCKVLFCEDMREILLTGTASKVCGAAVEKLAEEPRGCAGTEGVDIGPLLCLETGTRMVGTIAVFAGTTL